VLVSEFHYQLPDELIAQQPLADRSASRMLHLRRGKGLVDRTFREFPGLLRPDDLVVFNNTRVFPARLYGRRGGANAQPLSSQSPAARDFLQGRVEVLLTRQTSIDPNEWECLVRPGRKIGVGATLFLGDGDQLQAEVVERGSFGERKLRFHPMGDFFASLERLGHVPLPPYISREDRNGDR
jgi:S-adenosylmethionine:tRNA ribosyltransferase-isomerase